MRTVSSLEAFHSSLNRSMPKRSNFFKFIDGIKLHESRKTDRMFNLFNNIVSSILKRKHKIDQERENKIKNFTRLLDDKQITIEKFLQAMAADKNCMQFIVCFSYFPLKCV